MLYNIYFQSGYNSEKFKENNDPIEAETAAEALGLFEQHIIDTFNPDFDPETEDGVYYATEAE